MGREPVWRGVDDDGAGAWEGSVDLRREQFEGFCGQVEPRLRRAYVGWRGPDRAADATAAAMEITRTAVGTHVQRGMASLRTALSVEHPEGAAQW